MARFDRCELLLYQRESCEKGFRPGMSEWMNEIREVIVDVNLISSPSKWEETIHVLEPFFGLSFCDIFFLVFSNV